MVIRWEDDDDEVRRVEEREGGREGGDYLLGRVVGRDRVHGRAGLVRDDLLLVEEHVEGAQGAEGRREGGREGERCI